MNSRYANTSCFTSLPIDIVRIISTYLPPKASVSLMLSCRRILIALKRDRLLWRSILHQLEIHFEERDFDETSDNYWFCSPFRQFVDIRRRFLTYQATTTQKNHRLYYNIRFEPQENPEDKKNIVHTRKNRGHKQETMERLIEHSTIVYDYDESFFVLIQSIDRSEFWQSYKHTISVGSVPVHSRASVYSIRHGSCHYRGSLDLPFEVAAQDVKVDRGMLFLLPIKHLNSDDDPSEILLVYDISDGETGNVLERKASFCLTPSVECPERYRMPPSVYKESGEKRIYIINQENQNTSFMNILIIVPCPIWTVLVIKLSVPDGTMTLWKEEQLTNACYDAMGQLFTADQKNNTVAVALYASPTSARRYKSLIAVIDVPSTPNDLDGNHVYFSKESQHTPTIDILSGNTLPDFLSDSFDLYGRVQDMKLYYVSATNYYHSSKDTGIIHEKAQKRGKKQGYYAPILVFLLASDKIVLYSSNNPDGQHLDLQVLLGSSNRFNSKNWHYSELQVQDKVSFKTNNQFLKCKVVQWFF